VWQIQDVFFLTDPGSKNLFIPDPSEKKEGCKSKSTFFLLLSVQFQEQGPDTTQIKNKTRKKISPKPVPDTEYENWDPEIFIPDPDLGGIKAPDPDPQNRLPFISP
jgi:hypothetical protein